MTSDLLERFWAKVDKTDSCWNWTASGVKTGYGRFGVDGKLWLTHRYSWTLVNGEIPFDMYVLHRCDNPRCVNPDHLFLGTQRDNMSDMISKGRRKALFGEIHGMAKLTWNKVEDIRFAASRGISKSILAGIYHVSSTSICRIANGQSWKPREVGV